MKLIERENSNKHSNKDKKDKGDRKRLINEVISQLKETGLDDDDNGEGTDPSSEENKAIIRSL